MFKKIMSLVLACVMIATLCPGVMANDTTPSPSVEEILSEYHQKAFEAKMSEGEAYSRQSGGTPQTLEHEAVNTLNEAGYEAYNLTADNYATLEDSLQTDFSSMGIDENGSYIVVISDEDTSNAAGGNSRVGSFPEQDIVGDDGGGTYFTYTYGGTTYKMRYVTITALNGGDFCAADYVDLRATYGKSFVERLANTLVTCYIDCLVSPVPVGTIASLFGFDVTSSYTFENETLIFQAQASWTRTYVQIWEEELEEWLFTSYSEYASIQTDCTGLFYNKSTKSNARYNLYETRIVYSKYYNNIPQRKLNAVLHYLSTVPYYDRTSHLKIKYEFDDGTIKTVLTLHEDF